MRARREGLLLAACVATYLTLAGVRALHHTHPYYDDVSFLDVANRAREIGGPVGLLSALYAGTWTEDNRNPLYVAVLSLVAGRDAGFHTRARILTIGLGLLALFAWWRVARKHLGQKPALILAAFLAVSECFIEYSARESCEPLLVLLWALAVDAVLDGIEHPRRWPLAGVYAGLAQLDKGSGIFLVFCFYLALLLWRKRRALSDPWAWSMGAAFLAVASPLLVRNARVYGSPLHHWNNRFLWINRLPDFAEVYAPGALDKLPHGFSDWAAHTNWREIWFGRGVMALAETAVHLGDSMSFVAPAPLGLVHIPGVVLGLLLFGVALRLLWRASPSFGRTFLLVQTGFFVAFFLAYSVVGGSSRYVFPMTLCLYAILAAALARHPEWLGRWLSVAGVCIALALSLDPPTRKLPVGYAEAGRWLETHLVPGDNYAVDSRSEFEPQWFLPASNKMEIVSSAWQREPVPAAELMAHFRRLKIRYVLIDSTSHTYGVPRYFFYDVRPSRTPQGLREVFSSGVLRILEIVPERGAPEASAKPGDPGSEP